MIYEQRLILACFLIYYVSLHFALSMASPLSYLHD